MRFRPEPAYQKIVISLKPDRLKANRAPKIDMTLSLFL